MRKLLFLLYILMSFGVKAQVDSTSNNEPGNKAPTPEGKKAVKVFYYHRLINANTVEMLPKGYTEFKVVHNFGNVAGQFGGVKNAFGLDNSTDIKIGFVLGLGKNLNMSVSRNKGFGQVLQLWEMGFKYRFLQQRENDASHPLSIAAFANMVMSSQVASKDSSKENFYNSASDRQSQTLQLMIARKFGKLFSFQLNPTFVHTNFVVKGDQKSIFALGAGVRVPICKEVALIADYFHSFRSESSKAALRLQNVHLYDVLGVGLEILTPGHVFHMNFTNTHTILENRFIPRTTTSWAKGEYRWGFTVSRNFVLFKAKRKETTAL